MRDYIKIYNLLKNNKKVIAFNNKDGEEADRIAHSLVDIEESFNEIYKKYFPLLEKNNLTESEVNDILLDIGEEFRHILYHLNDMKYFAYLQ